MKILKRSILIATLVTVTINIMFISFISYKDLQDTYDRISNNLYFENKVIIQNETPINWHKENFSGKYRITAEIDDNCRLIIADTTNWIPPLLSGYYPKSSNDSFPLSAIIGKNLQNKTISDTVKNSIIYFEKTFNITGIVGTEYITSCDDLVILFGLNYDDFKHYSHNIIIDSPNKHDIKEIIEQINAKYPNATMIQTKSKGTSRITHTSYFCRLLYFEIVILTIFTLLFISFYFHEKCRNKTFVYYLFGLSPIRIILFSIFELILINTISFILSFLVAIYIFNLGISQLCNYFFANVLYTFFEIIIITFLYNLQLRNLILLPLNRKEKK